MNVLQNARPIDGTVGPMPARTAPNLLSPAAIARLPEVPPTAIFAKLGTLCLLSLYLAPYLTVCLALRELLPSMIRLQVLGKLELTRVDETVARSVLTQSRRVALLTYLTIAEPYGFHRRDKLLGLFWPELDETHARNALRQAIHFLRRELGDVIQSRGDQEIQIDPERLECDARLVVDAFERGDVEGALELYGGDLLDGFFIADAAEFSRWLDEERERLKRRVTDGALKLSERCAVTGDDAQAKDWASWATRRAPYDEAVVRRQMELLDRLGDRAEAVQAYEEFAVRLREEMELDPSPETQALMKQLRERTSPLRPVAHQRVSVEPSAPSPDAATPSEGPAVRRRRLLGSRLEIAAAGMLALAVGVWIALRVSNRDEPLSVPEPRQITFSGDVLEATLSSDGRFVAYVTQRADKQALNVLERGAGGPVELHLDDEFLCCPGWSPDGSHIVFRTLQGSFILPRLGGATPRQINARNIAAWSPDGLQLYSWWPQAQRIRLTLVASNDTASFALNMSHEWVQGVHWSPVSNRLAVIVLQDQSAFSLWTLNVDGSDEQLILEDSVNLASPHWSPSGDAVYYHRGEAPDAIWRVPIGADGSRRGSPTRVMSGVSVRMRNPAIPSFAIAADGRTILYPRRAGYSNLWLFDLDNIGATPKQLTSGTASRLNPRISPDGDRLLFVETTSTESNLFVMPLERGPARQLTFSGSTASSPAWSPDGSQIAFVTLSGSDAIVRTIDLSGNVMDFDHTELTPDDYLAWAPLRDILYQQPDDRNYNLLDLDSGGETPLLPDTSIGWLYEPRPSPDGRRVAVWWNLGGGSSGLWVLSVQDGTARSVNERLAPVGWSRDGTVLYAMSELSRRTGGTREIFTVPLSGGDPELVLELPLPAEPWNVSVSSDGRRLVAALNDIQSDVWIVENFDQRRN